MGERVVPEKCMLRSERQTLHRLERTGALVFAFKTFLYPLPEVKAAGLGEEMAEAVEWASLVVVPGCGHLSTLERPEPVAEALRAWLRA